MDLSRDEAVLLLASLACTSDGNATSAEQDLVRERLAPHLSRLGAQGQKRAFDRLYALLAERGPDWAFDSIGRALPAHADRMAALRLAVEVIDSDGSVTSEEMDHLETLAHNLGLSHNDLRQATKGAR